MAILGKQARMELILAIRDRCLKASRGDKGRILNEFVEVSGFQVTPRQPQPALDVHLPQPLPTFHDARLALLEQPTAV